MSVHTLVKSKDEGLVTVKPADHIRHAVKQMVSRGLNAVAVVEPAKHLAGILTDHDVMRALDANEGKLDRVLVSDWMTKDVITCEPDTKLTDALAIMAQHHIRHLVIALENEPVAVLGVRGILTKIHEDDGLEINVLRDVIRIRGVPTGK